VWLSGAPFFFFGFDLSSSHTRIRLLRLWPAFRSPRKCSPAFFFYFQRLLQLRSLKQQSQLHESMYVYVCLTVVRRIWPADSRTSLTLPSFCCLAHLRLTRHANRNVPLAGKENTTLTLFFSTPQLSPPFLFLVLYSLTHTRIPRVCIIIVILQHTQGKDYGYILLTCVCVVVLVTLPSGNQRHGPFV
jgi:hypothetical protein